MPSKNGKTNRLKTSFSIGITLLFLGYIFFNRHSILKTLEGIKFEFFLLVVLGQVLVAVFNAGILSASLKPLKVKLSRFESFKVTTVSSFVNFFTPVVGGASARAVYLKSKHGLAYASYIGALYANYVIMFTVSFAFGLVGVLVIPGSLHYDVGRVLALFFTAGVAGSLFFIFAGHKITGLLRNRSVKNRFFRRVVEKIVQVEDGWNSIRKDKKAVTSLYLWSFLALLSLMLVYWAATRSIGITTRLGSYMIFAALSSVSLLFNLTPGSIGVRETLYASTYKLTSINAQSVIAFSLVDRSAQLLVVGLSWMLFGNSVLKDVGLKQKSPDVVNDNVFSG